MIDAPETTALALPEGSSLVALMTAPQAVDDMLDRLEREARSYTHDLSTAKGRKAVASLAHKIARSKTALDDAGKEMNAAKRAEINAVDAERRKIRDRLDALKAEVRKPLDEWEAAEERRLSAIRSRLDAFDSGRVDSLSDPATILGVIAELETDFERGGWDEYAEAAAAKSETVLQKMRADLTAARKRVEQEEEIARLRAAEAARQAAEEKERRRLEEEQAARRAEKEAAERAAREEAERKEAEDRARQEAIEKARRDAEEAEERHQREIKAANDRAERAAAEERQRIEADRRREENERRARERDEAHRADIESRIAASLDAIAAFGPFTPQTVARQIMAGEVAHTKAIL